MGEHVEEEVFKLDQKNHFMEEGHYEFFEKILENKSHSKENDVVILPK